MFSEGWKFTDEYLKLMLDGKIPLDTKPLDSNESFLHCYLRINFAKQEVEMVIPQSFKDPLVVARIDAVECAKNRGFGSSQYFPGDEITLVLETFQVIRIENA